MGDPRKNANPELGRIRKENLKEQERLLSMLEQFYRVRKCPTADRIILAPRSYGAVRLINQAADVQDVLPASRATARLGRFRDEINDFVTFLERRYFRKDRHRL
jgi:hypothetical protein